MREKKGLRAFAAYGMIILLCLTGWIHASGTETEPDIPLQDAVEQRTEEEDLSGMDPVQEEPVVSGEILAGPVEWNEGFDSLITDTEEGEDENTAADGICPESDAAYDGISPESAPSSEGMNTEDDSALDGISRKKDPDSDGISTEKESASDAGTADDDSKAAQEEFLFQEGEENGSLTEKETDETGGTDETDPGEKAGWEYRYEDSMTFQELAHLPKEEAGAATVVESMLMNRAKRGSFLLGAASFEEGLWTCSDYYVNEPDLHHVEKEQDFSLKYQIEFHTSTDLNADSVEIRVPEALAQGRGDLRITPFQIGIPQGTRDNPVQSLNSPFNWFLDEADSTLVFFNYRPIASGTNTAFQVLYHPVRILELVDHTAWSITPEITVALQDGSSVTRRMEELEGSIDSGAQLEFLSADTYADGSIGCLPALYTKDQVQRILGTALPARVSSDESEWLFIAWQIDSRGQFNQPWNMRMDAALSAQGLSGPDDSFVVGSVTKITGSAEGSLPQPGTVKRYTAQEGSSTITEFNSGDLSAYMDQGMFHLTTTVVTALRKASLTANTSVLGLSVSSVLTPADGIDPESCLEASASWKFVEYQWKYKGDDVGIYAWTGQESENGSVSYSSKDVSLSGWINEYSLLRPQGKNAGSIPMRILSECRGYSLTHETTGPLAGSYIPGSGYEVTTADDVNYLASLNGDDENGLQLLGPSDYYYSAVSITVKDRGMDIFEDRLCEPMSDSECPGADRSTQIFVMYENSSDWELAAQCPWNRTGKITYTFPKSALERKIWRVKVVHHAVDYDSSCRIDSRLCLRPQSPVCGSLLPDGSEDAGTVLKAEHLGSVLARGCGSASAQWFHDCGSDHYVDAEPGLSDLTMSLYGIYSMRDCSYATLSSMIKHARALKTIIRENDPQNGCLRMICTIGAMEGYRVYSAQAARQIADGTSNLPRPDRNGYVIYDLLPEGVQFDPSSGIRAGLVTGHTDRELVTPSVWNCRDVSVRVDPDSGVCRNWRNTGRDLVAFHVDINLEKEQIPRLCGGMWMNGVGVQFSVLCPYKDLKRMKTMPNIAAVMPSGNSDDPACQILGTQDEVSFDDGVAVSWTGEEKTQLEVFGPDIDADGTTNLRTVLYTYAWPESDTAVSLTDGISLTVKADREAYSEWDTSAHTGPHDPYTYRIDVTNTSSQPISEIVIAAHLERAGEERALAESDRVFDRDTWTGFFESADVQAARRAGIAPVVWLNEDPEAMLPSEGAPPDEVLVSRNGWIRAEEWTKETGAVRSVAVELRRRTDGSAFELGMGDNVHIFLHMTAPGIGDQVHETRAEHAYQCASFYSTSQDEPDGDLVECNAVEVTLEERNTLIVEKELTGEIRQQDRERSFLFCLLRKEEPVPLAEYRLEEKSKDADGHTVWVRDDSLHTTRRDGTFSLKCSQRAVFEEEAGGCLLTAREIRSACFEEEKSLETTGEGRLLRFENSRHPVLYLTKKVFGAPDGTGRPDDVFLVRVTADGRSMAGMPYWTVNRTDGLVEDEVLAEHTVDENSCVALHAGEVIALHPGLSGCTYEVTEDSSVFAPGTDYAPVTVEKSGILMEEESSVTLENAWRWKDLVLEKEILHRGIHECSEVFSFRLWKMRDGKDASSFDPENPDLTADPASGVEGSMGQEAFTTDADGVFRLPCAGKEVRLKHLEALASYVVQETDIPADYEPVDGGLVSCTMPLLSGEKRVTVKNIWKKRSLEVSKTVLGGVHQNKTTVFTPGYPGLVLEESGPVELFSGEITGMTSFTLAFPQQVNLTGEQRLLIRCGSEYIDTFTGQIAAGETRTYTAASSGVSFTLLGMTSADRSGFFFWFIPDTGHTDISGQDIPEKSFSFCLEKTDESGAWHPCADTVYQSFEGEEKRTDQDGCFRLKAGEKAVFADLGQAGEKWRVSETEDPSLPQVYPSGHLPHSGFFGEEGEDISHALFINGEDCQGMFRKQFTAAPDDEAARVFLETQRSYQAGSVLKSTFLIEAQGEGGTCMPLEGTVLVADASSGELLTSELYHGQICLSENQTVILTGMRPGGSWRITELEQTCYEGQDLIWKAVCKTPSEGNPAVITASGSGMDTVFVNELHSVNTSESSLVYKAFRSGESAWESVPDGAVLTFCLERFEHGTWCPASGVNWIQCRDHLPVDNEMNRTSEDGMIRVRKESRSSAAYQEGCPVLPIAIGDGSVRTLLYYTDHEAQEGDLRIREVSDLSDPSFGMLAWCEGNTFINENNLQTLVVEKKTSEKSSRMFTMKITQCFTEGALPGKYLPFRVRDCETGEITGTFRTDAQGTFSIRGGCQAIFSLAEGTKWEVEEKDSGGWHLASCTMDQVFANPQALSRGMRFEIAAIRRGMTLTNQLIAQTLLDPFTGQELDFTSANVTIPHYVRNGDEIWEITGIADNLFASSSLRSVTIEDGIRQIGAKAFYNCVQLENIRLPDTLEEIGKNCFSNSIVRTLEFPAGVKSVGKRITSSCYNLTHVIIHQNEAESVFRNYEWLANPSITVEFTG